MEDKAIERLLAIIERQNDLIERLTTALMYKGDPGFTDQNSFIEQGVGRVPWNQLKGKLEKRFSKNQVSEIGVPGINNLPARELEHASKISEAIRSNADGSEQAISSSNWKPPFSVGSEGIRSQDTYGEEETVREELKE